MKPFKLNPREARQVKRDLETKDKLVLDTSRKMNAVLKDGVDQVYAHYLKTGRYKDPNLSGLDELFKKFYHQLLIDAVSSCKSQAPKKKRLAALPDPKLPDGVPEMVKVLNPKSAYFRRIMRRAQKLKDAALTNYLDKLRKQFKKVLPLFESTELSPKQAKQEIAKAWKSSEARTTTIFRTEATKYFASAQVAYFEDSSEIIGFLFDSVRDTSRTPICKSRHGLIYRPGSKLLEINTPPCHYNCRSHLIPLANDHENRKMLEDPARDPEKVKVVPFLPNWRPGG